MGLGTYAWQQWQGSITCGIWWQISVCNCDLWGLFLTPQDRQRSRTRGVEDIKWGVEPPPPIPPRQFPLCMTVYTAVIHSIARYKSPFSRTAAHIFVSPGYAPGAITLNVVWMESEFDVYKLSRCMCPSNYYRFWDTARYLWKNRHFIIPPLHSTSPLGGSRRNIATPFGTEKLEWCRYPMVKKCDDMFIRFDVIHERDRRTDRQTNKQTYRQTYRHHMTA